MSSTTQPGFEGVTETSKRIAQRILDISQNRFELLVVEVQEERERIMLSFILAMSSVALGMLAGVALTIAIILLLWPYSPVIAAFVLAAIYLIGALAIYARLNRLRSSWKPFDCTLSQFQKDLQCLQDIIP